MRYVIIGEVTILIMLCREGALHVIRPYPLLTNTITAAIMAVIWPIVWLGWAGRENRPIAFVAIMATLLYLTS